MNPMLAGLLKILRLTLDFISEIIFFLLHGKTKPLPPLASPLLLDSATVLARKIREKKITSVECVRVVIERIKAIDPVLTCVVDSRFDQALREAGEVDRDLENLGPVDREQIRISKPFLGVPFSCKDCFSAEGLSHTAGLHLRKDIKGEYDAPVISRMKKAGGILLCVSNVSELCMWWEANNTVTGRTCNPYHTGRIAGGSSGGEGCLIGAGATPVGIGSDVGGSIRMPCFFNGIFGHKPSSGIVPNAGQIPVATGKHQDFLVTGPMCRHAEDLAPMLAVLAGPEKTKMLRLEEKVDVRRIKFYFAEDDGGFPLVSPVHPELKIAQRNLIAGFRREFKVEVEEMKIKELYHSLGIWVNNMVSEQSTFCSDLADNNGSVNPWLEMMKWIMNLSKNTLPAIILGISEKVANTTSKEHLKCLELGERLKTKLNTLLGEDGVLIYPSHSTPAPYHSQPLFKSFNFSYTAIFNILGVPVTQVPLGVGSWGVPLGVQVVAGANMDRNSLAVAMEAQRMFGGWYPPSPVL